MSAKLSWNRADDGVITVYANHDGKYLDLADVWLKPLVDHYGDRIKALAAQERISLAICAVRISISTEEINGDEWLCPIGEPDCSKNCGNYGCGN